MDIMRDGKKITLTDEEIRSLMAEEHKKDIRYEYEFAVQIAEEDGLISFDNWETVGFAEYKSIDDARSDFIDKLTEDYLETEYLYERDPSGFRQHDFSNDVYELAKDLDYGREID